VVEQFQALLQAEAERRQRFYAEVSESRKAEFIPDICYFAEPKSRAFTPDQVRFPAPEMVVEVLSESTEAIDRGVKFEDYALSRALGCAASRSPCAPSSTLPSSSPRCKPS
jgi:Uma2 family endonuclease